EEPVVGAGGPGAVGAAAGVLAEGAGAPDVGTRAVDLGVVTGPDTVAEEQLVLRRGGQLGGGEVEQGQGPGAVLGEGLKGLPVPWGGQADEGLGGGGLPDVQGAASHA